MRLHAGLPATLSETRSIGEPDDELDVAVLVAARQLLAEPVDEREGGPVAVGDQCSEAKDPLRERERPQLPDELPPEPEAVPPVDDLERDLRLGRVLVAHEARDSDREARLLVDRDDGLMTAAADVDEVREVALEQTGLGAEEAQPAGALGEPGEDFEHGAALARREAV